MSQIDFYRKLYPSSMSKSVEMLTKSLVKQDILDNEESQSAVYDYIFDLFYHEVDAELSHPDEIGNYVNCGGAAFKVLPNIPIMQEFLKKWNVTPFLEGKKWIITLEEIKYFWFNGDIASYRMDFEDNGALGQSYDFYVKSFPASEIKEDDYEDIPFEKRFKHNEEEEKKNHERLENCTNDELLAEIMKRYWDEHTIDTDEIKEGLHLMFNDDGKLKPKRTYDFSQPYHTPFLDYGGDEFHIDPVLRRKYFSKEEGI